MSEEMFMVCQESGCISSIKFDITLERRAERNNGLCKYSHKRRNCCIEQ